MVVLMLMYSVPRKSPIMGTHEVLTAVPCQWPSKFYPYGTFSTRPKSILFFANVSQHSFAKVFKPIV